MKIFVQTREGVWGFKKLIESLVLWWILGNIRISKKKENTRQHCQLGSILNRPPNKAEQTTPPVRSSWLKVRALGDARLWKSHLSWVFSTPSENGLRGACLWEPEFRAFSSALIWTCAEFGPCAVTTGVWGKETRGWGPGQSGWAGYSGIYFQIGLELGGARPTSSLYSFRIT